MYFIGEHILEEDDFIGEQVIGEKLPNLFPLFCFCLNQQATEAAPPKFFFNALDLLA